MSNRPSGREIVFLSLDNETSDAVSQHEVVARRRPVAGLAISGLAVLGLGWVVITDGTAEQESASPPTTHQPRPTAPPLIPEPGPAVSMVPVLEPRVEGRLQDGTDFEVWEPNPGVLCAVFANAEPAVSEPVLSDEQSVCHLELVSGSGAAVIDGKLIFGYLRPGAASASLRYRTGITGNDGLRVEPTAQFFALPIRADDPYRLQYRSLDFEIIEETPLVPLSGGPSQTAADATRDGVPAAIAQLPFNRRVQIVDEWSYSSNGPFAWSRPSSGDIDPDVDPSFAELLLLDGTGTEILRAVPLPNVALRARVSTDEALYVIGEQVQFHAETAVDRGEIRFPIVVMRLDHRTGDVLVRVFPQAAVSAEPAIDATTDRDGWERGPDGVEISAEMIAAANGRLLVQPYGSGGPLIALDQDSLLPVGQN